ncbi:HVO_A0114 family putative DNA-binding protein [Chromobacterium vaccinii]|uniref:HVO_A0114 family putative DNA-binding protein n=1 Tax=Chromobacterium vaccinii TaxID=1108595 RepID=UPI0028C44582|nr:helix-turn-helix domain-containing protein [Chromobacterium vaccinii]
MIVSLDHRENCMRTIIGIRSTKLNSVDNPTDGAMPTVWFDSWRQLAGVLSDENRELLRLIRDCQPRTITELSQLSGRAASNLSRTLRNLEEHGLVRMHRSADTRAVRPEALSTEFLVLLG